MANFTEYLLSDITSLRRLCVAYPYPQSFLPLAMCSVVSPARTILAWNNVPATRVAMAISSLWPVKTFTVLAWESSGKFTGRPVRMRAAISSLAVMHGNCGRSLRG
jgi:hypothetical protein